MEMSRLCSRRAISMLSLVCCSARRTNCRVGIAERTEFIFLVLKKIGIYRARQHSITLGKLLDAVGATNSIRAVPQHMQSYGRAHAGQQVNLAGVG